jgi:glucose-6-phosphate dehydrogenase assembly protein OpcA
MSSSYKILGQVDMTSSSLTTLYTCPASTETVISTIIIANRASAADTFRLAMRDGGEAISDKHYLAYDVPVAANDSTTLTLGVAMQATDVLSIAAGGTASELSFNAFGAEVTI